MNRDLAIVNFKLQFRCIWSGFESNRKESLPIWCTACNKSECMSKQPRDSLECQELSSTIIDWGYGHGRFNWCLHHHTLGQWCIYIYKFTLMMQLSWLWNNCLSTRDIFILYTYSKLKIVISMFNTKKKEKSMRVNWRPRQRSAHTHTQFYM